jgi:hypothetical protein
MKMKSFNLVAFLLLLNLLFTQTLKAIEYTVYSVTELKNAINNSAANDIISLADGTYLNTTLTISKNKITVKALNPGKVFLNGNNNITISGNNVIFSGFQFTSNTTMTGSPITVIGNSNTLTQLNFNGYSSDHMIYITGSYNTVLYSNFQNKPAIMSPKAGTGDLIQIIPNGIGENKIRYCSFQKLPGMGGDYGNECIRIGNSSYANVISRTIVEYCYFEDTGLGDSETISVKSKENVLRFNTMRNNQQTNFCFRNGNDNVAYGNFFINSGGIRIKEANNIYCYNNYFENCGDGSLSAPIKYVYDETSIVDHLNNLNFVNNTFVGGTPIQLGKTITPNNGNVSVTTFTNNTWANNIFNNTTANIFSEKLTGNSFIGNIYQGNLGITIPPSGMANTDPLLTINSEGYFGLSSNSPAINASSTSYPTILDIANIDDDPYLLLDISRQTRVGIKDVGCDEYSTGTVSNRPLTLADVGPSYLMALANANFELETKVSLYPNPAKNNFNMQFPSNYLEETEISIVNTHGQVVKKQMITQSDLIKSNTIEFSELNSGFYFVKIQSSKLSKTIKLIVQ